MRSVIVSSALLLAFGLGAPAALAQPEPAPAPSPAPEGAVRRGEHAQPQQAPAQQAPDRRAREAAPPVTEPRTPRESGAVPGSVRREPTARDSSPREVRSAEERTRTAADEQRGERPGAVRRPPQDGRGGTASPRDRAVVRTTPPVDRDGPYPVYIYPDYWSYGRYYSPYYSGFHLGYLAYSPWGWTPAFYGYPYYAGHPSGYGYDIGRVRLKVSERDAEVYVDGYYAGTVDDFDGVFQGLRLESGAYRIEIRKPGYETLYFDVRVQPDRTITFRGEMRPVP